jgi:hypothetical protein
MTEEKAKRANKMHVLSSFRDQAVRGSNPRAPTILFNNPWNLQKRWKGFGDTVGDVTRYFFAVLTGSAVICFSACLFAGFSLNRGNHLPD